MEEESAYSLLVDYDLTVEDAIEAGRYNWSNPGVTSRNFPSARTGQALVELVLVTFNHWTWSVHVLKEFERPKLKPAELLELLALGEKCPDLQCGKTIVALGSISTERDVPILSGYTAAKNPWGTQKGRRDLDLVPFGREWQPEYRFAAIRHGR
jgi:hypothetical protein